MPLSLAVVDKNGVPIDGYSVTSSSMDIKQTENKPPLMALSVIPHSNDSLLRIRKQGYLDGLVFFEGIQGPHSHQTTLIERAPPITFDAGLGGQFFGPLGTGVEIPPGSLRKPDGSAVTGPVELYITPIDTSHPIVGDGFPGSFYGVQNADEEQEDHQLLFTYGVANITFEQEGVEL
ncbi:hypothetical protein LRP49_01725 [Enterovibrio sp. ZSDZ35]|uniref:Uncharacterized protein n=1 Tax=Enterovibrio qingdaonensis TaxID=2899818 RepID=A0ABT5QFZ5_9GAMM|nr:hypothetical protein [Enterovibrio sp. ZSDZ35]MDD1779904.1 hypothetical protein [Enterovibrio sp. ZSDZ35]